MAGCDLQNGRLFDDCSKDQRAGVKTVYFFPWNKLKVEKNPAGEISYIGSGTLYRFEQDSHHGMAFQEVIRGNEDSLYLRLQIDLTVFYIDPDFYTTIQALKNGMWGIFFLDYDNKIRLLGEQSMMSQIQMIDQSGKAAGDKLFTNLAFQGAASQWAPFLEDFDQYPFDNFPEITVVPEYPIEGGYLIYNEAGDRYLTDPDPTLIIYR